MASVRKREWTSPSGERKTAWVVAYTDQKGKRRIKTLPTKKSADAERLRIENEIEGGVHVAASDSITVSDALDRFFVRCEQRVKAKDRLRPRTLRQWRSEAENHVRPKLGRNKLTDLSPVVLQRWIDDLAYDPERPCSKAMIKHVMMIVRQLFKFSVASGFLGRNLLVDADLRIPGKGPRRTEIPSKEEIRSLLAMSGEVLGPGGVARYLRPLLFTAVMTGLRQGELRALRWEDVDFDKGVVRVRRGADNLGYIDLPKSAAGIRDVEMSSQLAVELKKWKLASQKLSKDGLVFVGNRGGMVQPACIQQAWGRLQRRVMADAAAKPQTQYFAPGKYHFHSLRHVAASLFIDAGLPPKRVQYLMGHSSIQMTFDTYGHLFEDADAVTRAVEKIGKDLAV